MGLVTFSQYLNERMNRKSKPEVNEKSSRLFEAKEKPKPPITQAQAGRSNAPHLSSKDMELVARLTRQGWDTPRIAAYFDRDQEDIEGVLRDLARIGKSE